MIEGTADAFYGAAFQTPEMVDDPLRFQARSIADAATGVAPELLAVLPSRYNRPTQGEVTGS